METKTSTFDLENRLLDYSVRIIRLCENMRPGLAARHVASQLLRSGTAALPNHAEAQAAESAADFVHKLKICLKELRETKRWLQLVEKVPLVQKPEKLAPLLDETEQLIRIIYRSIETSRLKSIRHKKGSSHES